MTMYSIISLSEMVDQARDTVQRHWPRCPHVKEHVAQEFVRLARDRGNRYDSRNGRFFLDEFIIQGRKRLEFLCEVPCVKSTGCSGFEHGADD